MRGEETSRVKGKESSWNLVKSVIVSLFERKRDSKSV